MPEEYPPYPQQPYPSKAPPYQQFGPPAPEPPPYYGGQAGYQNSYFHEQSRQQMEGGKHATNGAILGGIGAFFGVMLGWIPFLGLLAVAAGVSCGIPAILQGKKAEAYNVSGRAGVILGWIAIGFSAFWTLLYLFFMIIGTLDRSTY